MDDYIYHFEIDYNRDYLFETVKSIKFWPAYADPSSDFMTAHKDILFPINIEAIKIKNSLLRSTTFSFSVVPPGHETGWHTDKNRGCTMILPIDPEPHLIKFKIDNKEIDYFYHGPVITNAKTWHNGINHTDSNRYNLLFHFDLSYEDVKDLILRNELVETWKQTYNIAQLYKSDILAEYFNTHSNADGCVILITDNVDLARKYKNKFVIFIGDSNGEFVEIIGGKQIEIIQSIKFILDSPFKIRTIRLE